MSLADNCARCENRRFPRHVRTESEETKQRYGAMPPRFQIAERLSEGRNWVTFTASITALLAGTRRNCFEITGIFSHCLLDIRMSLKKCAKLRMLRQIRV